MFCSRKSPHGAVDSMVRSGQLRSEPHRIRPLCCVNAGEIGSDGSPLRSGEALGLNQVAGHSWSSGRRRRLRIRRHAIRLAPLEECRFASPRLVSQAQADRRDQGEDLEHFANPQFIHYGLHGTGGLAKHCRGREATPSQAVVGTRLGRQIGMSARSIVPLTSRCTLHARERSCGHHLGRSVQASCPP